MSTVSAVFQDVSCFAGQHVCSKFFRVGSEQPMLFCAALIMFLCDAEQLSYHVGMQYYSTFSTDQR